MSTDIPLIAYDGEKDERFEGVYLLDGDTEDKTTVEDFRSYWLIRDWERHVINNVHYWFPRSSYSIDKDIIHKLHELD